MDMGLEQRMSLPGTRTQRKEKGVADYLYEVLR